MEGREEEDGVRVGKRLIDWKARAVECARKALVREERPDGAPLWRCGICGRFVSESPKRRYAARTHGLGRVYGCVSARILRDAGREK
jgi:hypothetical protein